MGLRAETCKEIKKESATKIHGQLTDQDLTLLEKKIISIAANVPQSWEEATMDMQESLLNQQSTLYWWEEPLSSTQSTQVSTQQASQQTRQQEHV